MGALQFCMKVFLWPGDVVRRRLGISVDQDGGIIRSFVNMVFWGGLCLTLALHYFL